MSKIRTPGSVIGAAVTMFIYAALLMICVGCTGIGYVAKDPNDAFGVEAMMDKEAPSHQIVGIAGAAFNLLFSLTLFACGIGVLFLSNIARIVAYLTCIAIPLVTLAGTIYNITVVFPVQERMMAQQFQAMQQQQPGAAPPIDFGMIMKGGAALGLLIAIGVPVLFCGPIIVLLSLKSARLAFAGETAQLPDDRRYTDTDDYDARDASPRERRAPPETGIQDRS